MRTGFRGRASRSMWGSFFSLGVMGVFLASLVMSGCSSGSGSDGSAVGASGLMSVEASGTWGIKPTYTTCGEDQPEILWAQQLPDQTNVGTVEIGNDLDYLYLKFEMKDEWVLRKLFVQVGEDDGDYPHYNGYWPLVGSWDHKVLPPDEEVYEEYTLAIPFTSIPYGDGVLDHGACGMTVYIFALVPVAQVEDGELVNPMAAWAGTDQMRTPSDEWNNAYMYYVEYEVQCCYGGGGEFRTEGQGGWGTVCHGWNPGCYRNEWFDLAFPDGLTIGCGAEHTMTFTSSEAVEVFIPTGGKPGPLEFTYENPTEKTEAGVLASKVLALALTLGFDAVDPNFGSSDDMLADQVFCDTVYGIEALSVQELFDEANLVLGGCEGTLGLTPGQLVDLLTMVNENYVDGEGDLGFLCSP